MARTRPGRTRTRRTNRREPLLLSSMDPQDFNIRVGEAKSIVCPGCRTWRRLMGRTTIKIRDHCVSDRVPEGQKHQRCGGANQLVIIDVDVKRWQRTVDRLLRNGAQPDQLRAARQFYKPLPKPPPPVHRVVPSAAVIVETVRRAYVDHREQCPECSDHATCPRGQRLAVTVAQERHREPLRQLARTIDEEQRHRRERRRRQRRAENEWAPVEAAVKRADSQRLRGLRGAVPGINGPSLPLLPRPSTSGSPEFATRRPIEVTTRGNMMDRQQIIDGAIEALEKGEATTPDGQDPHAHAEMLRTAYARGGLGGYAAFKAAQRILAM